MNFAKHDRNKRFRKSFIIVFVVYTALIFVTEIFYRKPLFDVSFQLARSIQSDGYKDWILAAEKISHFMNSYQYHSIILLFIYNYSNIFKSFLYAFTMLTSNVISGYLQMLYHNPLMYYDEQGIRLITPYICHTGWGNPSASSVSSTAMYLTLWMIIFDNSRLRFKTRAKYIFLGVMLVFVVLMNMSKLLAKVYSLNQIIFGMLIGLDIFFFLFYVIRVCLNNASDLLLLINFKFIYLVLINLATAGVGLLFFFLVNGERERYSKNIDYSMCNERASVTRLSEISLVYISTFSGVLGMVGAMKVEYFWLFKSNELSWRHYNFRREVSDEESLLSRLNLAKETQWNHTSFIFGVLRLLAVLGMSLVILIPYFVSALDNYVGVYIVVNILIPYNILGFGMFFGFKYILRHLKLTNNTIFMMSNDDLN